MRETITIPLAKPLVTQAGPLKAIVIREPTFDEYLTVGDPYLVAESPGGTRFLHENTENIRAYIALCMVEPKDPALLAQAGAGVAKQVKEALMGFFQPAASTVEAPATSRTTSRSTRKRASAKSVT